MTSVDMWKCCISYTIEKDYAVDKYCAEANYGSPSGTHYGGTTLTK